MEKMKLAAIYTVWDDWDLLPHSIRNILPLVDGVILVESSKSNYGEVSPLPFTEDYAYNSWSGAKVNVFCLEPDLKNDPRTNETAKRQHGLNKACELGYTHFIMMDADEFYLPEEFNADKKRFENPNLLGLVGRVKCYFRSPTLTIGYDTTLVPLIHKITPNLKFAFNRDYPFAWTFLDRIPETHHKKIRIDPTRSFNINQGVEWSETTMFHMSWVRSDIKKKIRNSTARANIERSTIVDDYVNARPGYFCKFYGKVLEETPNVFGLPELLDTNVSNANLNTGL